MKINRCGKTLCFLLAMLSIFACAKASTAISKGEKITYSVFPIGKAEYKDMGLVERNGRKYWFVTFQTTMAGFKDLEEIYADPQTYLPLRVERYVSWPLSKEHLIEEYDPRKNSLMIKKFVNNKLVDVYSYKSDGPYHNAILLPFYLRQMGDITVGWSMTVRLNEVFKVILVGIEDVKVNGAVIRTYHFASDPVRFEVWVSKDRDRLPILVKGTVGYSMSIQNHSIGQ